MQVLVVYAVSRFARNRTDHVLLRCEMSSLGITLRSVTEPIDDSATGQFVENLLAAVAQLENHQKADRTKAGMLAALHHGRWVHVAPIGYRNGGRGGLSLTLDVERAPLIRLAFERVATQEIVSDVLRGITALGLTTKRNKRLSPQTFHAILRNPIYKGRLELPAWDVNQVGDFEPIVSSELFDRVQRVLSRKRGARVPHHRENPDFPLRRFVRCSACLTPLTGSWSRGRSARYDYYHCASCGYVRVRRPDLEA